jgi:hypothetical protein
MRITRRQLRQLINEEKRRALNEVELDPGLMGIVQRATEWSPELAEAIYRLLFDLEYMMKGNFSQQVGHTTDRDLHKNTKKDRY